MRFVALALAVLALSLAAACGGDDDPEPASDPAPAAEAVDGAGELFPDVIDAGIESEGDGRWRIDATISSPYDSPERYADAWRVLGPDGEVLGVRELAHDHASEQPFTRSLGGVGIPDGVAVVTIEGRDQVSGWGGATVDLEIPAP